MKSGTLSEGIDKAFDAERESDYRSSRIGASIVGNPCQAYLAMQIRGFPDVQTKPRFKRIFRDGHRIETAVVNDLRKAGYIVHEKDPMTGKQYMWQTYYGYVVFFADGIIEDRDGLILLEVKSMNGDLWDRFKNRGLAVSHPKYLAQVQLGMGLSGFRRATLIAYNKDTSEYWDQTVDYDPIQYHYLLQHAVDVLMGHSRRIGKEPTDWRCKECPKRLSCWGNAPVPEDIRTCANGFPTETGWSCKEGCVDKCKNWTRFRPEPRT